MQILPALLLTVALTLLAGCSGAGDSEAMSADEAAAGGTAQEGAGGGDVAASGQRGVNRAAVQDRAIVHTGQVHLVSDDLPAARAEVTALLARYRGLVANEDSSHDEDGRLQSASLDLRVPAPDFDAVMAELATLGRLESSHRSSEDVTTEVVDVDARVATQRASLARLQQFLGRAETIEDVIRLESEIADRTADLEALEARQAYLADQTSLATITVHLSTPSQYVEASRFDDAGFLTGLRNGWQALGLVLLGAATVAGAVLPFLVAGALVGVPLWLVLRAVQRRGTPAPAPATAPATAPAHDPDTAD